MLKSLLSVCLLFLVCGMQAAAESSDSLMVLLARTDSDSMKIKVLERLAGSYDEHGMKLSLKYAQEMISLIDKQPDNLRKATHYADAAIIFLNCNVYDKSLNLLLKALKIFEREDQQRSIIVLKNTMGGVYMRCGKQEQALTYFKEGLEGAEQMIHEGDSTCLPLLYAFYNNIGLIYNESKDKSVLAGKYFEKALELISPNDYYNLGQCYNNMAVNFLLLKNYEKALHCASESRKYRELAGDELGMARTNHILARIYTALGDYGKAREYLMVAEEQALTIKSDLLLENIYSSWVEILEKQGDYKKATTYLHKQLEVQRELLNDQMLEKTTALEMEYDFEKRLAEHQLVSEKERHRGRLLLILAVMLVVVAGLLYLMILNRNRRIRAEKKTLVIDLENKNKELTTNVMYLMRNTEMVKDIITRLVAVRPNMKAENARVIKDIISDLEASLKAGSWSEFEMHFNNVHIDFYKKLQQYSPELTPTELKMCAFLRLNMSSKEISSISGITVKSVDVMRGRIRKKLNIANTEVNLIQFLSQF